MKCKYCGANLQLTDAVCPYCGKPNPRAERYAKDKEEITGISHEPWHFRYVGYPHSKIMQENGFSLEEYTQFIKAYLEDKKYLFEQAHRAGIEIYYVPAKDDKTLIKIPENCVYQISGNNIDGFVVTIWRKTDD